jgi:hypothetical protein
MPHGSDTFTWWKTSMKNALSPSFYGASLIVLVRQEVCSMDMETFGSPNSEAIQHLAEEHRHYSEQLEGLLQKPYLSAEEQLEEVRLKKLKLSVKDQIEAMRQGIYPQHVA